MNSECKLFPECMDFVNTTKKCSFAESTEDGKHCKHLLIRSGLVCNNKKAIKVAYDNLVMEINNDYTNTL